MISPPSLPRTAQPRICPLPESTTAFMKPRVSPVSMARMTALIGSFATRIARPCALASRSVRPARPSCGSMNIV